MREAQHAPGALKKCLEALWLDEEGIDSDAALSIIAELIIRYRNSIVGKGK